MDRPSRIAGLVAVTLPLLVGCGKASNSASSCRDGYEKLYASAVKLLTDASPSDPDIDARMRGTLGGRVPNGCQDPRLGNAVLYQVEREFDPQLAALEGKWGPDTISGFRDPINAGHGPPLDRSQDLPTPGPRAP